MLGLDSTSYMSIARHVVTENHDQLRLQLIRAFDDRAQLLVVDEPVVGVDVRENCDPQAIKLLRPVVDLDRLLANNQPAGLYQESPEDEACKKQHNHGKQNSQSATGRTVDCVVKNKQQAQQNANGHYKCDSHTMTINLSRPAPGSVILCPTKTQGRKTNENKTLHSSPALVRRDQCIYANS